MLGVLIPVGGEEQNADVEVYVRSNGVHTDVIMPTKSDICDWTDFIDTEDYPYNSSFDWIAIGWGDKGFFLDTPTWADLTFSTAMNAVFLPSPCAMHVEYIDQRPSENDMCVLKKISFTSYSALTKYCRDSFKMKAGEVEFIPGTSYWGNDHFYEAKGNYHLFHTCNSWTNGALKTAGIKTAAWAMFPKTIMSYVK